MRFSSDTMAASAPCHRCNNYSYRLTQINRDFNTLWDALDKMGYDPESFLNEAREERKNSSNKTKGQSTCASLQS